MNKKFAYSRLSLALGLAFAVNGAYAQALTPAKADPFSSIPLEQQTVKMSYLPTVQPNVFFLVDDSGSMWDWGMDAGGNIRHCTANVTRFWGAGNGYNVPYGPFADCPAGVTANGDIVRDAIWQFVQKNAGKMRFDLRTFQDYNQFTIGYPGWTYGKQQFGSGYGTTGDGYLTTPRMLWSDQIRYPNTITNDHYAGRIGGAVNASNGRYPAIKFDDNITWFKSVLDMFHIPGSPGFSGLAELNQTNTPIVAAYQAFTYLIRETTIDLVCRPTYTILISDGNSTDAELVIRDDYDGIITGPSGVENFPNINRSPYYFVGNKGAGGEPYSPGGNANNFIRDTSRRTHLAGRVAQAHAKTDIRTGGAHGGAHCGPTTPYANDGFAPTNVDCEGTQWDAGIWFNNKQHHVRQTIKTFAIGLGEAFDAGGTSAGADAAKDLLNNIASNGGTRLAGKYKGAIFIKNSNELADKLSEISDEINDTVRFSGDMVASVSPTLAVITTDQNKVDDNWAMHIKLRTDIWSGSLKFERLTNVGPAGGTNPGAASQIVHADFSNKRKTIISYQNAGGQTRYFYRYITGGGVFNFPADYLDVSNAQVGDMAVAFGFDGRFGQCNQFTRAFIPWTLRYHVDDANINDFIHGLYPPDLSCAPSSLAPGYMPNSYRVRTPNYDDDERMMGDVINSTIASVNKIDTNPDEKQKTQYLLMGANDGQFYFYKKLPDKCDDQGNCEPPFTMALTYLPGGFERNGVGNGYTTARALQEVTKDGYGAVNPFVGDWETQNPHRYFVDGGVQWRTTALESVPSKNQQTFAAVAMGRGARGAFSVNVQGKSRVSGNAVGLDAADSNWGSSVPLFETPKGAQNQLGYTVGTPQIGLTRTESVLRSGKNDADYQGVRQLMFLADGYEAGRYSNSGKYTPTNTSTLYVYEALGQEFGTGVTSGRLPVNSGNAVGTDITPASFKTISCNAGLSTPRLVDQDLDGKFDFAYAGDRCGNVWRFDFRAPDPLPTGNLVSSWSVRKIFDSGSNTLSDTPITTQPSVFRMNSNEYVVMVGTGTNLYQSDLNAQHQQYFYGIFDNVDRTSATWSRPAATLAQLVTQKPTTKSNEAVNNGVSYRWVSNNKVDAKVNRGWKIQFNNNEYPGERVVTNSSVLLKTVYFTTHTYYPKDTKGLQQRNDTCLPQTAESKVDVDSWMMAVDVMSGGTPKEDSSYFKDGNVPNDPDKKGYVGKGYVAGIKMNGLASGVNVVSANRVPSSIDPNGGGQSGEDGLNPGSNLCVDYNTWYALIADQSGTHQNNLHVRLCKGGRLVRINQVEKR